MIFNKNFSKKPIQQLEVIPEYHLLVSLTDNVIQVHDIKSINLVLIHQVADTRGANLFTLNIQVSFNIINFFVFIEMVVVEYNIIYRRKNNISSNVCCSKKKITTILLEE